MGWEEKLSSLLRIVMAATALSLLAIKINILSEIKINSSSSTDRGEGTSDFKTLSTFYQ